MTSVDTQTYGYIESMGLQRDLIGKPITPHQGASCLMGQMVYNMRVWFYLSIYLQPTKSMDPKSYGYRVIMGSEGMGREGVDCITNHSVVIIGVGWLLLSLVICQAREPVE